jgi:hypothetical protein
LRSCMRVFMRPRKPVPLPSSPAGASRRTTFCSRMCLYILFCHAENPHLSTISSNTDVRFAIPQQSLE